MTFFPVSVDELKYDKNRIFTRLKLRADPNTNAYAESIFPYLLELLRQNIELVLAYNITDNDLTIASPELSSCDMLAVCYCGATQKIVDCVVDCDFLIVYFHWGIEFQRYKSEMQELIAKKAVDFGADFVVGAHPHVLQEPEVYEGRYIYYSLGNFIFDKQIPPGTDETMILQITVGRDGLRDVREIPVVIRKGKVVRGME